LLIKYISKKRRNKTNITDIKEDLVFILFPLRKNNKIMLANIHIMKAKIIGFNPKFIRKIYITIKIKLRISVKNVLTPLFLPTINKRKNKIIHNIFNILFSSFILTRKNTN